MSVKKAISITAEPVPHGQGVTKRVLISDQEGPNFAMRLFSMEPGGFMPLHTNLVEHEQYVVNGKARLELGNEVKEVQKGDVVFIPAGIEHSYTNLGDEPFEFICLVPNKPDKTSLVIKANS